jgi:hypothetical protein
MIEKLSARTAASLRTKQHIYCAGTVAQCLHRWDKLSPIEKDGVFLSISGECVTPTVVEGEDLQNTAADPGLRDRLLR